MEPIQKDAFFPDGNGWLGTAAPSKGSVPPRGEGTPRSGHQTLPSRVPSGANVSGGSARANSKCRPSSCTKSDCACPIFSCLGNRRVRQVSAGALIPHFWLRYLGGIVILELSAWRGEPHTTTLGCGRRRNRHTDFPGAELKPMEMTLLSDRSRINIFSSLPTGDSIFLIHL